MLILHGGVRVKNGRTYLLKDKITLRSLVKPSNSIGSDINRLFLKNKTIKGISSVHFVMVSDLRAHLFKNHIHQVIFCFEVTLKPYSDRIRFTWRGEVKSFLPELLSDFSPVRMCHLSNHYGRRQ